MTDRNFNIEEENLTNEFRLLLDFMENTLSRELPTTVLDIDYFIYAALNQKDNLLYRFLEKTIKSSHIDTIENAYYRFLDSKALTAVKPDRKIVYDDLFIKAITKADKEKDAVDSGEDKISTIHMFLSILSMKEDTRLKQIFSRSNMDYNSALSAVKDYLSGDDVNLEPSGNIADVGPSHKVIITSIDHNNDRDAIKQMWKSLGLFNESGGHDLSDKKKEYVSKFCVNLNDMVKEGKIDPLIGRTRETNEIIRVLGRRKKNNVILIGGEGVGKTAIAENIAYIIEHQTAPQFLLGKEIVSLDMTALIAGTTLRGQFEERIKGVLDEVKANPKYILFIDNIGAALADKGKNDYDISSMISRSLETGDCQVIGTSDFSSYRKTFDKDPSLARRFQKVLVEAPTKEESLNIVRSIKESYEKFHRVRYDDEAVDACVLFASKYITERNLPDSAIDVLDEAGALVGTIVDDEEVVSLGKEVQAMKNEIELCKKNDDYAKADELGKDFVLLSRRYKTLKDDKERDREEHPRSVTIDTILDVIVNKTGIPANQLTSDDKKKLLTIDERLKAEVVGQDQAINLISRALKRNRVGLKKNGCMYSMMCIGKSGVGKTLIAKKLAKELFGTEKALIRFDMSEYPDKTSVNKLIGSNPGYVGYEEGGQLTEAIKNKKYCVLLLDEIEKADPEVYNIFLQVLDEGFLTDNSGQKVDFGNVVVVFTSNVGAKAASDFGKGIGFNDNEEEKTQRILDKQLKNRFPPEFLNRVDNIIHFNSLTDENLRSIIKIELGKLEKRMSELKYGLNYTEDVVNYLFNIVSKDKDFGARPIIRAIQDNVEDKITDLILEKEFEVDYMFKVSCSEDNEIVVE